VSALANRTHPAWIGARSSSNFGALPYHHVVKAEPQSLRVALIRPP
jgi:hypothetical protein